MAGIHTIDAQAAAPGTGVRGLAARLEAGIRRAVEIPAAILVAAEVVVLFAGIVARYVLHTPLVWSDELASILFLWLAMLGAVVAFGRGEHMRMTALVGKVGPQARAVLDAVALAAALAFLLMIVYPAYDYAVEESFITTPALLIAIFLIYGLYFGLVEPSERAWAADLAPKALRGTALGYYNGAVGLASLPADLLFGLVWYQFGPAAAFLMGALFAGLGAVLLLFVRTDAPPKTPSEPNLAEGEA